MVNLAYRAARLHGAMTRSFYSREIARIVSRPLKQHRKVPISVFSFSGEQYLPEQVACIRSFIRNVGTPDSFTIISDGSYSKTSCDLLRQCSDSVNIVNWDAFAIDLPGYVKAFADREAMGKKLAILLSMPVRQATIYTDADILFFPAAEELVELASSNGPRSWYLADCLPSLDFSILADEGEAANPVNAGFMLLKERLNWEMPLQRLAHYRGTPFSQTEQTIVHLAMHQNNATPLRSDKFVLSISDQFIYQDHFTNQNIALRHYVNNVRHKFWQSIGMRAIHN